MAEDSQHAKGSLLPGITAVALTTAYLIALLAVEKEAFAASDKIDFVPGVRFLRVVADGDIELGYQGAVRKDGNGEVAWRWRAFAEGVGEGDVGDVNRRVHEQDVEGSQP